MLAPIAPTPTANSTPSPVAAAVAPALETPAPLSTPVTSPSDARPVDVLAARANWRPNYGTLAHADALRAADLVQKATADLSGPHIFVNRDPAEAVRLLNGEQERLTTAHDRRISAERPQTQQTMDYAAQRRTRLEKRHDTLGVGPDRGKTVYGTLTWDLETINRSGKKSPQLGAWRYGQAAFLLNDEALDRSTFLPHDSVSVAAGTKTAAREQLIHTTVERIARDFGFVDDYAIGGNKLKRMPAAQRAKKQEQLLNILAAPDDMAIPKIQQHILSMPQHDRYIEAQIRGGVSLGDIKEIRLADKESTTPAWARKPTVKKRITAAMESIESAALLQKIPIRRVSR